MGLIVWSKCLKLSVIFLIVLGDYAVHLIPEIRRGVDPPPPLHKGMGAIEVFLEIPHDAAEES